MSSQVNEGYSNTIVARSDFDAARTSIEATIDGAIAAETDPLTKRLYQEMRTSLIQNMIRIAQPVEDNELHDITLPFYTPVEKDDIMGTPEGSDDEGEEEIDEEDLLDRKTLSQAKELRSNIRSISSRVEKVRSRVLERSRKLAVSELEEDDPIDLDEAACNETKAKAKQLKESLQSLSDLLGKSEWAEMPHQVSRLNDTMDVVNKEMDIDKPMSQTELAIVSRSNSAEDEQNENDIQRLSQGDKLTEDISASDRLALCFQLFA